MQNRTIEKTTQDIKIWVVFLYDEVVEKRWEDEILSRNRYWSIKW